MPPKKKNKKQPSLPKIKKEINDFMHDDEGKIAKKDVAKLGVSLAVLGMMMKPDQAMAQHSDNASHNNQLGAPSGNCVSHSNVTTHSNFTAHSSHSMGGWC